MSINNELNEIGIFPRPLPTPFLAELGSYDPAENLSTEELSQVAGWAQCALARRLLRDIRNTYSPTSEIKLSFDFDSETDDSGGTFERNWVDLCGAYGETTFSVRFESGDDLDYQDDDELATLFLALGITDIDSEEADDSDARVEALNRAREDEASIEKLSKWIENVTWLCTVVRSLTGNRPPSITLEPQVTSGSN